MEVVTKVGFTIFNFLRRLNKAYRTRVNFKFEWKISEENSCKEWAPFNTMSKLNVTLISTFLPCSLHKKQT
jgi:hypothetical protein